MTPNERLLIELGGSAEKESRQVDFKEQFDPTSAADWSGIVKDIIAMANSGGGILVFGVTDDGTRSDFDRSIVMSLDPADFTNKIHSYTGEQFSEFRITEVSRANETHAAVVISSSETPIVFTRNGADAVLKGKQKPIFLKGSVYFRHGAKSEPADTGDLRRVIEKLLNKTRKSWSRGVRKISNMGANDEVIISKRNPALQGEPLSLAGLLRVSEQGTPVTLTHVEFEALRQEYPLEYKEVLTRCKKKKAVSQKKLQAYINSCKNNQNLSINWREIGRSLRLPFTVPDKHMYKERVVDDF